MSDTLPAPMHDAVRDSVPQPEADRFRPQWHFTPAKNWINDPNGLVWFDGEYHLFFQYNPFGSQWGHMSWGHAGSPDLLHWQELPVAIPEDERVSIFSGSIVVDASNRSGFGQGRQPVLLAFYTGCRVPEGGQAQELAWSTDRGRTWTKYPGNPVLDIGLKDFRDPKVFWHEPSQRWVMAVVRPDDHQVSFYGSNSLTQWQHLSDFGPLGETGGIWECPDLMEFPPEAGAPAGTPARWLLKVDTFAGHPGGTGAQVFIGHFDGTRFTATSHGEGGTSADTPVPGQAHAHPHLESHPAAPSESPRHHHPAKQGLWVDHGSDFYAALSWAHLPPQASAHGPRPVWVGWMNNHAYAKHTPTEPWRGAMSVPRELFLVDTPAGPRLGQAPVAALQSLRGAARTWQALSLAEGDTALDLGPHIDGRNCEVEWAVSEANAAEFGLLVRCGTGANGEAEFTRIGVDRQRGLLFIDRQHSGFVPDAQRWAGRREVPLWPTGNSAASVSASPVEAAQALTLRVLIDRCSVEVFSGDGLAVLTELVFPADASRGLRAWVQGGTVAHSTLKVWPLRAAA